MDSQNIQLKFVKPLLTLSRCLSITFEGSAIRTKCLKLTASLYSIALPADDLFGSFNTHSPPQAYLSYRSTLATEWKGRRDRCLGNEKDNHDRNPKQSPDNLEMQMCVDSSVPCSPSCRRSPAHW